MHCKLHWYAEIVQFSAGLLGNFRDGRGRFERVLDRGLRARGIRASLRRGLQQRNVAKQVCRNGATIRNAAAQLQCQSAS